MRSKLLMLLLLTGCSANPSNVNAPQPEVVEPTPEVSPQPQELLVTSLGVWTDDEVLLYSERAVLAEALIQRVNAGDIGAYTAEPYAEAKTRWDKFLRGSYPNGKQCDDAPSPNAIDMALRPEALELETRIDCKPDCNLRVTVVDRDPKRTKVADLLMELPQERNQWLDAIKQNAFKPFPETKGVGGLGISGYGSHGLTEPKVSLRFSKQSGNWDDPSKDLAPLFQPHVQKFLGCRESNARIWRDWWANSHVLDIDATGRVTRCEQAIEDHLPGPSFDCDCKVIEALVNFGPGDANRRLRTSIDVVKPKTTHSNTPTLSDGLRRSAYLMSDKTTGDDPISRAIGVNALNHSAFQPCFHHLPGREMKVEVPVEFALDAQGTTESVAAKWPGAIPQAFAQCATPILKTADFACPMNKTAAIQTVLNVSVYK